MTAISFSDFMTGRSEDKSYVRGVKKEGTPALKVDKKAKGSSLINVEGRNTRCVNSRNIKLEIAKMALIVGIMVSFGADIYRILIISVSMIINLISMIIK